MILIILTMVLISLLVLWSIFKQPAPTVWTKDGHIWHWPPQRTFRKLLGYGAYSLKKNRLKGQKRGITPRNDWEEPESACGPDRMEGVGDRSSVITSAHPDLRYPLSGLAVHALPESISPHVSGTTPTDVIIPDDDSLVDWETLDGAAEKRKYLSVIRHKTEYDPYMEEKVMLAESGINSHPHTRKNDRSTVIPDSHYPGVLAQEIFPKRDTQED